MHAAAFMHAAAYAAACRPPHSRHIHAAGVGRGAVFEKGCFGVGWGGVLCTYISPKGVCDGGVKNRGWGWKSGQKETPSGQKVTPSGQFVRKVGKSALELGKKKSIIGSTRPSNLARSPSGRTGGGRHGRGGRRGPGPWPLPGHPLQYLGPSAAAA